MPETAILLVLFESLIKFEVLYNACEFTLTHLPFCRKTDWCLWWDCLSGLQKILVKVLFG